MVRVRVVRVREQRVREQRVREQRVRELRVHVQNGWGTVIQEHSNLVHLTSLCNPKSDWFAPAV